MAIRGQAALVLLLNIAEALAMPGIEDVEFEAPKLGDYPRPADLS